AFASLNVKILRGRLPENENELAMSDAMLLYYRVDVGDKLTLTVTDKSGEHEKEFLISGLTSDFYDEYVQTNVYIPQMNNQENFDINLITVPSIISGKTDNFLSVNMIVNIIDNFNYPESHPISIGQKVTITNNDDREAEKKELHYQKSSTDLFLDIAVEYVVPILIIFATIAGVYTAVKILVRGQKENIQLIKIVGGTNKQAFFIYVYEAVFISLLSSLLSFISGLAICYAYSQVIATLGLGYAIPYDIVAIISVSSLFMLITFYLVYFAASLRNKKPTIKAYRHSVKKIGKLWNKTVDANSGSSKNAFRIVVATSVIVFSAGCLWADFLAAHHGFDIETSKRYSNDYLVRVSSGTVIPDLLYYNLPVGCGVSKGELETLYENYPVDEKFRAMYYNIHPYISGDGKKYGIEDKQVIIPKHLRKYFVESGTEETAILYRYSVKGIPYEYLGEFIGYVGFSKEDYDSGKIAISTNGKFVKGDTFKISFVEFPDEINRDYEINVNELIPDIKTIDVSITHTDEIYDANKSLEMTEILNGPKNCIILSDNYLLSLSDKFRYDYVLLDNKYELSDAEAFAADEYISSLANKNRLHLYNHYIYPMIMKKEAIKQKIPYVAISSVYMVIVALFAYICINCEVRSREREFTILKSIGAEKRHIIRIISSSAVKKFLPAIPIALVVYFAFFAVLLSLADSRTILAYMSVVNILLYPIIIIAVITAITFIASVISANWVYKKRKQNVE
ncbi:MAG: ABC transporter permease, partial [Ruminiclostridium sp.]|nr:ABC transporter permease [Ruminiclostridium sp.]